MKAKHIFVILLTLVLAMGTSPASIQARRLDLTQGSAARSPLAPLGTSFTYQGRLDEGGSPAEGAYDFEFSLYDALTAGAQVGTTVTVDDVTVSQGLFSVSLDFGAVFDGTALYLQIGVRAGSSSGAYTAISPRQALTAAPYALYAPNAGDADTLDGLHASQLMTQPQNVVVVAKSGGDYTSVQAAIDSITDASVGNPYLMWVAPGVYEEQVTMKPYVHLQGAGQEATVISSTASNSFIVWPPTQATLVLASDTSLRNLTVINSGAGDQNVALLATEGMTRTLAADVTVRAQGGGVTNIAIALTGSGTGVTLHQVTALGENGSSYNNGLYNGAGEVTLRGGSFTGRGGTNAEGISNSGTLEADNVTALGENGSSYNYGLLNPAGAAATLRNGSFTGRGGTYARGIYNYGSTTKLEADNVTALGENGSSYNHGLYNDSAATRLRGGSFTGRGGTYARGIFNYSSTTTLEAERVSVLGENGSFNYGLYNDGSATADLTQSVLEGVNRAILRSTGTVTVTNSRLVGGPASAGVTCVLVTRDTTVSTDGSTCP